MVVRLSIYYDVIFVTFFEFSFKNNIMFWVPVEKVKFKLLLMFLGYILNLYLCSNINF